MEVELRTIDLEGLDFSRRSSDERIIEGVIMRYGETITINGRGERFLPGAFGEVDPDSVLLLEEHKAPIGRGVSFEEDGNEVRMAFRVADTARGSEVLQLAGDRILRGLSVGFKEIRKRLGKDGAIEHMRVALKEASTVRFPAYSGAAITGIRSEGVEGMETQEITDAASDPTQDKLGELEQRFEVVERIEERLDSMSEKLATFDAGTPKEERATIDPVDWFMAEALAAIGEPTQKRALADVVGVTGGTGEADGLMPMYDWAGGLVNVLDASRPFYSRIGRMPFPTYGDDLSLPVVKSGPKVGKRAAQKGAVNSEKLVVEKEKFDVQWFDGGVDVALELIRQANPAVMGILWDRLSRMYAIQIEAYAIEQAEAVATASGAVFDASSYGKIVEQFVTQSIAIKTATGAPGDRIGMDTATWIKVLSLVDSTDRRQFATRAPENADGSSMLTAQSVGIGGIQAFHAPGLAAPVMFNVEALKGTDTGPARVEVLNVEKLGRDIAVWGGAIVAPIIHAGIVAFKA